MQYRGGCLPILNEGCGEWGMIRRVMKGLRGMVLLGINVNTEDRYRGWGRLMRASGLGIIASLALSACNGCTLNSQQPLAVSCHSFTSGRILSQGISEGQTSMGKSEGVQKTRLICILIHTQEELDAIIESQE